jgi:hypothetical protein
LIDDYPEVGEMIKLLNIDYFDHKSHHKELLCTLADRKQMLTLARLAKDGKFFCTLCGRVSTEAQYVCAPTELSRIE